MRFREIDRHLREGLARYGRVEATLFDSPGTTIAPVEDRERTSRASAYLVGAHTIIYCDSAVADTVRLLADPARSLPPSELRGWATGHGYEFEGGGWIHLVDASMMRPPDLPEGTTPIVLDADDPDDRALIADLVDAVGPDDADEADVNLDNLDPFILALVDQQGRIGAYASERPFEYGESFADIAVLTRPEMRAQGWGSAAVSTLCEQIFDRGRLPLYRCNWENSGSRRLALSLGFVETVTLAAMHLHVRP
jgi:GNAT superfamily N-acetyltransferase